MNDTNYQAKGFFWSLKNLDKFNSSFSKEILAGLTTFLTMSYIVVVNPAMLSDGTGMPFSGVVTATILVCVLSSILMGLYANLPYGLAPGMGLNAFFAITLVKIQGIPWQTALGAVFLSGIVFILLSLFKVRRAIVAAIPLTLRRSIAAGIGLFITFIGLNNAGFIVPNEFTCVSRGAFTPQVYFFLAGLLLISILTIKKVKGGLLIGMAVTTIIAIPMGRLFGGAKLVEMSGSILTMPDFTSVFMQMDLKGALTIGMLAPIFTFLFTDMFDSISTFVGISEVSGMVDKKGQPKNVGKALLVDAVSTTLSGIVGSSSGTTYVESAAGVEEGGRTGLTAVVIGLLFLPLLFFSNIIRAVPAFATAPVMVIIGVYMIQGIGKINFKKLEEGIPAFLSLLLIPLTFSITQGIVWGFLSYTLIKLLLGKYKEISPMLYVITGFSVLALIFG